MQYVQPDLYGDPSLEALPLKTDGPFKPTIDEAIMRMKVRILLNNRDQNMRAEALQYLFEGGMSGPQIEMRLRAASGLVKKALLAWVEGEWQRLQHKNELVHNA